MLLSTMPAPDPSANVTAPGGPWRSGPPYYGGARWRAVPENKDI